MSDTQVYEHGNGARRQSWKHDNPRDLLLKIIRDEGLSRDDAMEKAWHLVSADSGLIRTIFEYWFANNYSSLKKNSGWTPDRLDRQRRDREDPGKIRGAAELKAQKAELKQKVKQQILISMLDMMMPIKKKLRDCTGFECEQLASRLGGWLMRLATEVGSRKVGEVLSEERVRELYRE